jgi:hypothetical protein
MAIVDKATTFLKDIPTRFRLILGRVTTEWATEIPEVVFLLLEVPQA